MRRLAVVALLALAGLFCFQAPAQAQPCQWNYSLVPSSPAGIATATYCGNVVVDGTIIAQGTGVYSSNYATMQEADAAAIKQKLPVILNSNFSLSKNIVLASRWIGSGGIITLNNFDLHCDCSAANYVQMFNRNGTGFVYLSSGFANITWWGAKPDQSNDISNIVFYANQSTGAVGGVVYFPPGKYSVASNIEPYSDVAYLGEKNQSWLVVSSASSYAIFNETNDNIKNVVFKGLGFDGSLNYPSSSTVYKSTYDTVNVAIANESNNLSNVVIEDNVFKSMSSGSINLYGYGLSNISIKNNSFSKGSYVLPVIYVHAPTDFSEAQRLQNISIVGNTLQVNGPQFYYDPSKADWTSSSDGISLGEAGSSKILNNFVSYTSSIGIRVELSDTVIIANNNTDQTGASGISAYHNDSYITITGNTVTNFGRIPFAYGMNSYGGGYWVASEFPSASGPTLPANPSITSWFYSWPYSTDDINLSDVTPYSDTNYFTTGPNGILPFRGFAGINFPTASLNNTIGNNTVIGNLSVDGSGKYLFASNFGISPVHPVNAPTTGSGAGSNIVGNQITSTKQYPIYAPLYEDPINSKGLMGKSSFGFNQDEGSLVSNPTVWIHNIPQKTTYQASLAVATGSITTSPNYLNYTVTNGLANVSGQIVVSASTGTSGQVTFPLPFLSATAGAGSAFTTQSPVIFYNATGLVAGDSIVADIEPNSSIAILYKMDASGQHDLGSNIVPGMVLNINLSYPVANN